MSERVELPDALRRAVAADIEPVKPLPPPWVRILWAGPLAAVMAAGTLVYFGLQSDLQRADVAMTWLPMVLQITLGLAVLAIALQETVPGMRVAKPVVYGVCLSALALHLAVNIIMWLRDPMGYEDFLLSWWGCIRYEILLGVPFLAIVTYMAGRALPIRPRYVGLLAGFGAGVIADASWRMVCPVSIPTHFLTAHLGGMLILGATGYLFGAFLERRARLASDA